MYIYCNVPLKFKFGSEYYTEPNAQITALLEELESVVIEEKVIYKDGSEKQIILYSSLDPAHA